ncbi:uncharacterized protein LOC123010023 [Tribolium madens]|uniref:uncharacterized protein LOC123010023 n=1 Tax=Tribolium madens TaxID=41895 RepID=UPI001CF71EF9|nr:uncharacterized protein LOC123010023 [Tribolium madens]
MFFYTSVLFVLSWINKIEARNNKPKICKFRSFEGPQKYNFTWKTVHCPNSWCCSHGCCPWYINFTICVFLVVIVFSIIKILEVCCKKAENAEETTEMATQTVNYGTAPWTYPNYAYSSDSLGPSRAPSDPAPSYDEVVGHKIGNQSHTQ